MKFLCVPCDRPMSIERTMPPDRGSIALIYGCPDCGYEIAMLTNAATETVGSLGVKLKEGESSGAAKCPFTGMVSEMTAASSTAAAAEGGVPWTAEATARLAAVPELVQPIVRSGIEQFARERGYATIDERVLEEARSSIQS